MPTAGNSSTRQVGSFANECCARHQSSKPCHSTTCPRVVGGGDAQREAQRAQQQAHGQRHGQRVASPARDDSHGRRAGVRRGAPHPFPSLPLLPPGTAASPALQTALPALSHQQPPPAAPVLTGRSGRPHQAMRCGGCAAGWPPASAARSPACCTRWRSPATGTTWRPGRPCAGSALRKAGQAVAAVTAGTGGDGSAAAGGVGRPGAAAARRSGGPGSWLQVRSGADAHGREPPAPNPLLARRPLVSTMGCVQRTCHDWQPDERGERRRVWLSR